MTENTTSDITTAAALGRYRRELIEEGIPEQLADQLVLQAAQAMTAGTYTVVVKS